MSLMVDETADDLPVRDVGLTRGGLMPTLPDTVRDSKPIKKSQVMKIKDQQRLFHLPREHLEDQCVRLQEENSLLKQHTRTQEQKLRRMSVRLMRLREASQGQEGFKERDVEETIQELEARVVTLESQKGVLRDKLSLARQHILDLGRQGMDGEGGMRRAAQTAPPHYGPSMEDTRAEIERLQSLLSRSSVIESQQVKVVELEMAAQAVRDTVREKERAIEGTMRDLRKQQGDAHRLTIRDNVDVIRLQKQLSDKNTALRVTQEKVQDLQEVYENQMEQSQWSLKESQSALLEKVEELSGLLKQERERVQTLEGQLTSASLSLHALDEYKERISDLEKERSLLKESYDNLLESTLSIHRHPDAPGEKEQERHPGDIWRRETHRLEEMLRLEREERGRLEEEKDRMRQEKEILDEQRERERELSESMREKRECLEKELSQNRQQISTLQEKLDSVTEEFDMSVEELSETLLQIKTFRLQQETRASLSFLGADGQDEGFSPSLAHIQASHAEAMLELQKTRELLLVEHRISNDLQEELKTVNQRLERDREESRRRLVEKDKLLAKRGLQINTLQAQLKELAYSPRNYKRNIPIQYTWPGVDQEVVQPIEDDLTFSQLRQGESLLEIHLKAATFTPTGLRSMGATGVTVGGATGMAVGGATGVTVGAGEEIVTFCTYAFLDFEVHSTPLVSGSQPNYGFTSRYTLSARDLGQLAAQVPGVRVELHQATGGVRFVTCGSGQILLADAMERRGERISGSVSISGSEGDIIGVVDFWARLFPPAEPVDTQTEREADRTMYRRPTTQALPLQPFRGWQDHGQEQDIFDYGGGIPNELLIVMERCVDLSACWPGLLPDPYLTYRFYDLPPHVSPTLQCTTNPAFNDAVSYPLAVTADVLQYLGSGSLWVYVFDDSDDQIPPAYLAKTPVPLRALATGKEIRGDYVLRDSSGGPRGMVRVLIRWKYPFQMPTAYPGWTEVERQRSGLIRDDEKGEIEELQRPVAKPRQKPKPRSPPVKLWRPQDVQSELPSSVTSQATHLQSPDRKRSTKRPADAYQATPARQAPPFCLQAKKSTERSARSSTVSTSRSVSDTTTKDVPSLGAATEEEEEKGLVDIEALESAESSSSSCSDVIISPPKRKMKKGDNMRVEILSLTFGPSSSVALNKSVQSVYVEYRLLGVPMETTETPMSLRKPPEGEEIHYNFTRVIYVDGSEAASLRQYLYTMLEGTDPSQGRLKFTVVSEPIDDALECVDVGQASLDLQELLLTGNDVIERQIDIVSMDEEKEVIGKLKVSLEAAKALSGIYWDIHSKEDTKTKDRPDAEDEEAEAKKEDGLDVIDYDEDSDF